MVGVWGPGNGAVVLVKLISARLPPPFLPCKSIIIFVIHNADTCISYDTDVRYMARLN